MYKYPLIALGLLYSLGNVLLVEAEEVRSSHWEIEAGVLQTRNMEIHGYQQGNATEGWESTSPTFRLEYWTTKMRSWNHGIVLQPLSTSYHDTIKNDLSAHGQVFHAGDDATLKYQFHTLRFTANYPLLASNDGSYLRLGGSLVARYAQVDLQSSTALLDDKNFLVVPLINMESDVKVTSKNSVFLRADFLPSINGNVFLDGLFDVMLGFRRLLDTKQPLDVGIRLFFGGYDPNTPDDYANKIFFQGFVVRYSF